MSDFDKLYSSILETFNPGNYQLQDADGNTNWHEVEKHDDALMADRQQQDDSSWQVDAVVNFFKDDNDRWYDVIGQFWDAAESGELDEDTAQALIEAIERATNKTINFNSWKPEDYQAVIDAL
jgi:hypothetical protein